MNTAIIVAAGSGNRFAATTPKQFVLLLGKPLIIHTLEKFDKCPVIDQIILVLSANGRDIFEAIWAEYNFATPLQIVEGGATRAESVKNALAKIDAAAANIVAVHDGVRPLVSVDEIVRTVESASITGAACLVADLTDTIKQVDGDRILGTIDRNKLRRALTPQAFRYEIIRRAYDGIKLDAEITDDCYLVEKLGVEIGLVEGNAINIKITRPEDLTLAEAFLKDI